MPLIKQYVNLPSGTTNIHGPTRDLRVTPSSVPNVGPGDRIEWWIEPAPGASNTSITYLSLPRRAKLLHPETTIGAGGAFENQVSFPPVGGDKFVVKVAKKNHRADFIPTDEFETWRKLYYSVFYMGAPALNMFNSLEPDFKAAFAEGKIEIENVQKTPALTQLTRVDLSTTAAIGRPNFHFLGGAAAPGGIVDLRPTGAGALLNKPFHVALIVVPDIYRIADVVKSFSIRAATGTTSVDFRLFQYPGDPRAFVYAATVGWTGHPAENVKPRLSLVGAPTDSLSQYSWDLRAVAGLTSWLANPGHSAQLDLSLVKESPGIMGYSIYNLCVVRTIDGLTDVLQTFTHELGHGIRQAVEREDKYDAAGVATSPEVNPKWHTDNFGGRGNHCSTNAVLSSATPLPAGLTSVYRYGGAGLLCTMFYAGERHVDPKGKFCPDCLPRVKRVNLDSTSMVLRWNQIG